MLSLQDLKDRGLVASHVQLVEFDDTKYVELAKYKQLALNNAVEGLVPVCDKPQWIAVDEKDNFVYSKLEEGDKIAKVREGLFDFRILSIDEDGFTPEDIINLALTNELKEQASIATKMLRNKRNNKIKTNEKEGTNNMNIEKPQINMGNLNVNDGAQTKKVELGNAVQPSNIGAIKEVDNFNDKALVAKKIQNAAKFNKSKGGSLVGLIVKNDSKVDVSAVAPRKTSTDEKNNAAVDLKPGKKIEFKQSAPGPVAGGIIRIPEGGFVGPEQFTNGSEDLGIDETKINLVDKLLGADELYSAIGFLFNSQIDENPETYGEEAATTIVKLNKRTVFRGKPEETTKNVPGLITTRQIKKPVHPDAYLPLKTYPEMVLDNKMTKEQIDLANNSLFYKFYIARKRNDEVARTVDSLDGAYAKNISLDEDNNQVSSTYISEQGINIEAKNWYDKKTLQEIKIPIKELKEKDEDGVVKISQRLKSVNVLGKTDQEMFSELNSAVNPKFETFRNATSIDLSVATLVRTFKGATVSKKQKEAATSKENIANFLDFTTEAATHVKNDSSWLGNFGN